MRERWVASGWGRGGGGGGGGRGVLHPGCTGDCVPRVCQAVAGARKLTTPGC